MNQSFFRWKWLNFILLALIFIIWLPSASALVSVSPASSALSLCPGENFSINISISGVSNVYGFQFDLSYNSSALNFSRITNGTFLSNNGQNSVFCLQPNTSSPGIIRNIACSRIGESGSVPASGVLANISFRLRSVTGYPATSSFVLSNVKISDINSASLDSSKSDGQASLSCTCTEGQRVSCNDANGCPGNRTCTGGSYGSCVTPTPYFCDSNCDGTSECRVQDCTACQCTGSTPVSCTTTDGCPGTRSCTNGVLGACQITGFYCDADCDGTPETCNSTACLLCGCSPSWDCDLWSVCSGGSQTRSCADLNDCGTDDGKPIDYRTCTVASSSGGGGGGGGSILPTSSSCVEAWVCDNWFICGTDGFRRRTCVDANSCGTSANKPVELETCFYEGRCNDGIMNGMEEGIDCGGACPNPCLQPEPANILSINLIVEPIAAEILDQYALKVIVENLGQQELLDVELVASKWSMSSSLIRSILPGVPEQAELVLNLPVSPDDSSVSIQAVVEGVVVASKNVPVMLSVPEYSVKINHDPKAQRTYQAVIIDNRGKPARAVQVDFTISKGKETYIMESGKAYELEEDLLFHQVDYLHQTLPAGSYEIKSVFYDEGQKVAESISKVVIGEGKKALNVKYFFYALLLAIVAVSGYIFFMSQKKNEFD